MRVKPISFLMKGNFAEQCVLVLFGQRLTDYNAEYMSNLSLFLVL